MIRFIVDADDVELADDGRYEVELWLDDIFEEIDDIDLEEEYDKRGLGSSDDDDDDDYGIENTHHILPKQFNKTQLRDVLTDIARLGSHASDDDILEQLRFLMNF